MTADPHAERVTTRSTVVVAGDVCIDWLSIPVDSLMPELDSSQPMNWQLRGGRHMYAVPGGAWLSASLVKAAVEAVGCEIRLAKPQSEPNIENAPPERIVHSILTLGRGERLRDKELVPFWVVNSFEGYAGPPPDRSPEVKPIEDDDRAAAIVVIDDAGNGFRDREHAWPEALNKECSPLVLYKVRRPLVKGELWKRLEASHLPRTIALLSADEMRAEGANISRALSWERTAVDLVMSLAREPRFSGLRRCQFLIVPLALEGAVLLRCSEREVVSAHLWYIPNLAEGDLIRAGRGNMSGFGSAFTAAIASQLVKAECDGASNKEELEEALKKGIREGLRATHNLLEEGFGRCEQEGLIAGKLRKMRRVPEYPAEKIFKGSLASSPRVSDVSVPLPDWQKPEKVAEFHYWRILDSKRNKPLSELAAGVVRYGVTPLFEEVPIGEFGKLITLDRSEIESYRGIRKLIREFLARPKPERPLCLAVFGPPGGGKSFGVKQVARSIDAESIDDITFNVSQWDNPSYLAKALHQVRDRALRGKVPLVFFDEFDTQLGDQKLGWLKYFLAPMQDGVFSDVFLDHVIGKAIFVFAGGTADRFADFRKEAVTAETGVDGTPAEHPPHVMGETDKEKMKELKVPDFLSRLRGFVDVFGFDPPADTNLLRRALVLGNNIRDKFAALTDAAGSIRIDDGVLEAFLRAPKYAHGARSIEAILEMSHLSDCPEFDPSRLPPRHQLDVHVSGRDFLKLVEHQQLLGEKLEDIAKEIHELFLRGELAKKDKENKLLFTIGSRRSLYSWDDPRLLDLYRNSSREQAASYPTLLAAVGCTFEKAGEDDPDKPAGEKRDANRVREFTGVEIEKLARMEHERWMQERRIKEPDHRDLKPWEELSEEDKDKDRRTIKAIPEILLKVGLREVRLA